MTDLIRRLDESPPDIMVADNPKLEGYARLLRVAERCRHPRIGNRDDDVRVDMAFPGEFYADALARLINARAFDNAVGACEIDVLEDAEPVLIMAERHHAADSTRADDDDLSGLDVPLELGTDDVERA